MGYWSIEFVCDNLIHDMEMENPEYDLSGEKYLGGEKDGVENTMKIVKTGDGFLLMGHSKNKKSKRSIIQVTSIARDEEEKNQNSAVGIIVTNL